MSARNYMSIREFRNKYNLPTIKGFSQAVTLARIEGWKGMRVKTRFSQSGEYVYPESSLKKIARSLQIFLSPLSASTDRMMTVAEFRTICPVSSKKFSSNVARYSRRYGLVQGEGVRGKRYPFSVLKRFAEHEGYEVPALPGLSDAASDTRTEAQAELPLGELAKDAGSANRETLDLSARHFANQEKIIGLLSELLAEWKGVAK